MGGERLAQCGDSVGAGDGDGVNAQPPGLLGEQGDPGAGGEACDPEPIGVALDEVDGLGADRTGAAEDHDIPAALGRVEDQMRIGERGRDPGGAPHGVPAGSAATIGWSRSIRPNLEAPPGEPSSSKNSTFAL
ncbi:hypothetical protein STSP_53830 [Streptomyces jeddahensis]|uniref:Uncharacterized protein n=1 Tax=Streptomyces jeddahensis TaxID=1716141 RepID=A0A177HKR1_9ACTN|nr:hypothetical protein STSP_53830 [Streptomyces jeddahensis]